MKQVLLSITIAFIINSFIVCRAQDGTIHPDSLQLSVRPYGSFRGHFAFYNKEVEFQENGSRIGFEFSVKKKNTRFFVRSELQMNMFKGNSTFNADANLADGFLVLNSTQSQQVFATRLGYLGVDMNKFGTISVGKQWSVYFDVTSYTDRFNVFGGQASATYVANTDGGETGTGRADQVLLYRNRFGPVSLGAQVQARTASNNNFVDGYGISAQLTLSKELKTGFALVRSFINDSIIDNHSILGITGQPVYISAGAIYTNEKLELAVAFAHQTNGDLTQGYINDSVQGPLAPTVIFGANGFELYGKYRFGKMAVLAGYNYYNPDTEDITTPAGESPVSDGFRKNYAILGFEYRPVNSAYFYAEQRFSNGKTANGTKEVNALTLGLRIDIERIFTKNFKAR